MARVAKNKAEDLEAARTPREPLRTRRKPQGVQIPPRRRKGRRTGSRPPRTRPRRWKRKSWCMWGRSFPVGG